MQKKVLFICQHNSGRSLMAEAYLKKMGGDNFVVESAGFEPAEAANALVVAVMKEEGIDLSAKKPQSVFELFKSGRLFDVVITVCADTEDKCPVFPGIAKRLHVPFSDPSAVGGSPEEKLAAVRVIRNQIKEWLPDIINATH